MKIGFILLVLLCFSTTSYAQTGAVDADVKDNVTDQVKAEALEGGTDEVVEEGDTKEVKTGETDIMTGPKSKIYINCASYFETWMDSMRMQGRKYKQRYVSMTRMRDGFLMSAINAAEEEKVVDPETYLFDEVIKTREEWGDKFLHQDNDTRMDNMVKARDVDAYCKDLYIADKIEKMQDKRELDKKVKQKLIEQNGFL